MVWCLNAPHGLQEGRTSTSIRCLGTGKQIGSQFLDLHYSADLMKHSSGV